MVWSPQLSFQVQQEGEDRAQHPGVQQQQDGREILRTVPHRHQQRSLKLQPDPARLVERSRATFLIFLTPSSPSEQALEFISRPDGSSPYFLYFAPDSTHGPTYASAKFRRRSVRDSSYGDAVMELDWSVGQILELLRRKARQELTLSVRSVSWSSNYFQRGGEARHPGGLHLR